MEEATCNKIAEFIAALSNPYRVRILCVLCAGELNVGEIARTVGIPPSHVSSHLRILYAQGYINRRREVGTGLLHPPPPSGEGVP